MENEYIIWDFVLIYFIKDRMRMRMIVLLSGDGGVVDLLNGIGEV